MEAASSMAFGLNDFIVDCVYAFAENASLEHLFKSIYFVWVNSSCLEGQIGPARG